MNSAGKNYIAGSSDGYGCLFFSLPENVISKIAPFQIFNQEWHIQVPVPDMIDMCITPRSRPMETNSSLLIPCMCFCWVERSESGAPGGFIVREVVASTNNQPHSKIHTHTHTNNDEKRAHQSPLCRSSEPDCQPQLKVKLTVSESSTFSLTP